MYKKEEKKKPTGQLKDDLDYEDDLNDGSNSDDDDDSNDVAKISESEFASESDDDDSEDDSRDQRLKDFMKIWNHYRPKLVNDISRVAYVCSPHPTIMVHANASGNNDPEDHEAVERVIDKWILSKNFVNEDDREKERARLIHTFWLEHNQFVNKQGYFAKKHIWYTAGDDNNQAHTWHHLYSLPNTLVFGKVACIACAQPLGIGQAERNWKAIKRTCKGHRNRLAPVKGRKQAVVCAAYSDEKSESRRMRAQRAGELWTEEDYTFLKLDHYCSGSVMERIREMNIKNFRCYEEDWEKKQFDRNGDGRHASRVSAKYGGIKFLDEDTKKSGVFLPYKCAVMVKCSKATTMAKKVVGKGYIYNILGVFEGFDEEVDFEVQDEDLYEKFERNWTFYEMIEDYYREYPDPNIRILKEKDDEGNED